MSTRKDEALKNIFNEFGEFANLVLLQLDLLGKIVASGNTTLPKDVVKEILDNENKIDKLEVKLSDKITDYIVLYQPLATDLRKIIAAFRIIINLERIGDLVTSIIRFIEKIKNPEIYVSLTEVIANMHMQSSIMVNKALLSFTNDDREFAIWTIKNDSVVDEINQKMLNKAIKKSNISEENKELLITFINMNGVVSNIERIADYATNIAEAAIYSIEGKDIRHKPIDKQV
jgi:phosphate transport system protein